MSRQPVMTDEIIPDRPGFALALKLSALLIVQPRRFMRVACVDWRAREARDKATRRRSSIHGARVRRIRRGLLESLLYVVGASLLGGLFALLSVPLFTAAPELAAGLLQALGAAILLWATLFVRGWDIQSMAGNTLPERANQWIYRSLASIGSVLIVWGTAGPLLAKHL